MKKFLLLFVMLLASFSLYSQNWAPINTTEKFCYETDTAGLISHVLWVDSVESFSDYEVYYLNKIAAPCDTCAEPDYYLLNQPQFLLHQIKVYDNGDWIFQENGHEFKIIPNAPLTDSWIFDETNNTTATVVANIVMEVLGETDSIKVISIDNGQAFGLSKEHGIFDWYGDFVLIGIEGRNLGTLVPKFADMFSRLSVNDVLCYYIYSAEASKNVEFNHYYIRYEILGITLFNDSVVIETYYHQKHTNYEYGKTDVYSSGELNLTFYPTNFTEAYPNLALMNDEIFPDYNISRVGLHRWGGFEKTNLISMTDNGFRVSCYEIDDDNPLLLIPTDDINNTCNKQSVNYGFLEREIDGFEWSYSNEITGVIDNGDTLGIIYPIDMFVGQEEINHQSNLLVYPSPTKEKLHIKTIQTGQVNWYVFDVSGRIVQTGTEEKTAEDLVIRVGHLPKGLYIIQLEINGEIIQNKFLKD